MRGDKSTEIETETETETVIEIEIETEIETETSMHAKRLSSGVVGWNELLKRVLLGSLSKFL